jgi:branched-chain amino acid transport system permease protein
MEFFTISMLNGLSYGLLLFMLSSGLTLIFSMMGVLNFAHASFYMIGAYIAYSIARVTGFWPGLVIAPLVVGVIGALFERLCLRRVHKFGHVPELLITFGLSFVIGELVLLIWGRTAVEFPPPEFLRGPAFTLVNSSATGLHLLAGAAPAAMCSAADAAVRVVCSPFPATRGFMMLVALAMLVALWLLLTRTRIGLVIQSALTHPEMVEALGHNVPRVFMLVFGAGAALAGLAGVIGGMTFVTEPAMAASVGPVIFVVVVVGGMGSLAGAFVASLLIGIVQTFAVAMDYSLLDLVKSIGLAPAGDSGTWAKLTIAQVAPILPFLFHVLILIFRPKGLLGTREG